MSVEAQESMSEAWTRWQGHVINGVFPLGRYLGCSDHSGVFLTKSTGRRPAEVAIKLVPVNRALAESLLPRWKRAGALAHPHLLRLVEWGGCQLDGLPYLYAVMEYADQTLAQLLPHRALTEDEAREMLLPILDALSFLHHRSFAQGQLKPTNILVVGDQLKLASDTIRHFSEGTTGAHTPSAYDPPEPLHGGSSAAGDIWGLGVSLFEALTRRQPRDTAVLPADFAPAFRDIVTRCLSPRPQDRPSAQQLAAWAGVLPAAAIQHPPAAAIQPAQLLRSEPTTPVPAPPKPPDSAPQVVPEAARPAPAQVAPEAAHLAPPQAAPEAARPVPPQVAPEAAHLAPPQVAPEAVRTVLPQGALDAARRASSVALSVIPRTYLIPLLGAVAILVLGWIGVRAFKTHPNPAAPPPPAELTGRSPGTILRAPAAAAPAARAGGSSVPASPAALREVIPDVPRSARRTIRGHIKVWVRVIVEQDGSVLAAVPDRAGPSRYFERLAVEAAKKWTFPPVDTPSRRLVQVRFDFGREGTTGRAVAIH